jgi:ankyrin repeat protein
MISIPNVRVTADTCLEFYYPGDLESTKKLLELEIDINNVDNDGWSPLFMAVYSRHLDSVNLLLYSGANVNLQDDEGKTPIDRAIEILDSKIIYALLETEEFSIRGE